MPDLDAEAIFAALAEHEVEYVLVGGLAGVMHGSTGLTEDADILPNMAYENLERLAACLRSLDARLRNAREPEGVPFDPHPELLAQMSALTMTTRFGDLDLCIKPAALGDYASVMETAVLVALNDDLTVPIASLDDIIRSKETAGRPKDQLGLPYLYALRDEIEKDQS